MALCHMSQGVRIEWADYIILYAQLGAGAEPEGGWGCRGEAEKA